MMLSKNKIKYIRSLELKKNRKAEGVFLAEGHKLVGDLLPHFTCRLLVATHEWLKQHPQAQATETIEVNRDELQRASLQQAPQEVLALFDMPQDIIDVSVVGRELCLALDEVQDPGNLGTILRIADWFGIHHLFCSPNTADVFSPKAIQATMGAIARVHLHYCDLPQLLRSLPADIPVFGTFLDGANIYTQPLARYGLIIMGNEGKGISTDVSSFVTHRLFVPNYPPGGETSESLNVAVATAIVCAEFRRR